MYIIKNAFKSIVRNKARNILIGVIVLVIATASCVALSIRQAAETAKEDTLDSLSISAQISYDRSKAMADMQASGEGGKGNFDPSKLQGSSLSLDDYLTYSEAESEGDSYYYTITASLNANDDLLPYGSTTEEEETTTSTQPYTGMTQGAGGGMGGDMGNKFSFMVQGDFSITGYSSYDAMISLFGEDGTYSISDGQMFDEESSDLVCVISDELAMYNELLVGDTITLVNPNNEDETYSLTISGIYTNSASSEGNQTFAMSDPANNIYMSYNALNSIITSSKAIENAETNDSVNETSTALTSQLNFTYTFANSDNYYNFAEKIYDYGLSTDYIVSSTDLSAYENSLTPLNTLSTMAGWFFLIVLAIGGIILVVFNIFNLRERKYEIGVLTAIGMKKHKVATQFITELFAVTLIAIVIGTSIGSAISVPVTNSLLANQIESAEASSSAVNENFGFSKDSNVNVGSNKMPGGMPNSRPGSTPVSYIASISSATNITVVLQLIAVGILLTIISGLAALISIMRYEPLKILSSRS